MYEFLEYRVEDVMTTDVTTTTPDARLGEVELLFDERDFNSLPVLDASGDLVGVVTKLDLLAAFRATDDHMFPPYAEIVKRRVADVMTRDPATVTPRAPLSSVLEKLVKTRRKSFPVVDGQELVGIVSREDVLGALRRAALEGERPKPG